MQKSLILAYVLKPLSPRPKAYLLECFIEKGSEKKKKDVAQSMNHVSWVSGIDLWLAFAAFRKATIQTAFNFNFFIKYPFLLNFC